MKSLLPILLIVAGSSPAPAAPRCACIANGERIQEGQITCIRPRYGTPFLARCEIVLNNTSWTKLQEGCPTASAGEPPLSHRTFTGSQGL